MKTFKQTVARIEANNTEALAILTNFFDEKEALRFLQDMSNTVEDDVTYTKAELIEDFLEWQKMENNGKLKTIYFDGMRPCKVMFGKFIDDKFVCKAQMEMSGNNEGNVYGIELKCSDYEVGTAVVIEWMDNEDEFDDYVNLGTEWERV